MVSLKIDREAEAAKLAAEASRGATVIMTAGVRELHMLANHTYKKTRGRNRPRQDQCTMLKLIAKGVVYYNDAGEPVLSAVGKQWRKTLVAMGRIDGDSVTVRALKAIARPDEGDEFEGIEDYFAEA